MKRKHLPKFPEIDLISRMMAQNHPVKALHAAAGFENNLLYRELLG